MQQLLQPRYLLLAGGAIAVTAAYGFWIYKQMQQFSDIQGRQRVEGKHDEIIHGGRKMITQPRVEEAMLTVDRANYTDEREGMNPYADKALPIGFNATISAPHMHALGLEFLLPCLTPGARVLDVGSGSGYMSACFAYLVGPEGRVFGIEHVPELIARARENIRRDRPQLLQRIDFRTGDGRRGIPEEAPFDAIYLGAAAPEMPQALLEQLKPGGRMLLPLGAVSRFQQLVLVEKAADGTIKAKNLGNVSFVPLIDYEDQIAGDTDHIGIRSRIMTGTDNSQYIVKPHIVHAPDMTPEEMKQLKEKFARQMKPAEGNS